MQKRRAIGLGVFVAGTVVGLMGSQALLAQPGGLPSAKMILRARTQQQNSAGTFTAPLLGSPGLHALFQGHANYLTCIDNVTGATAIAFTCLGVATTHTPGGGVAGLLIGAGAGHFLLGPLGCTPDPAP